MKNYKIQITIGLSIEGMPSIEKETARKDVLQYAAAIFGYGNITESGGVYKMKSDGVTIEESITFALCVDSSDYDDIKNKMECMAHVFCKWYSQECIMYEEIGPKGYAWDFIS